MAQLNKRDPADRQEVLHCESSSCPVCGSAARLAYHNDRRLIFLTGSVRYIIKVRR